MASAFELASGVTVVAPNRFTAVIPDGWQQGRGAFGGLVLATLLRAIEKAESDGRRAVRTLTGDIAGPVLPGEVEITVDVLRRGTNQSNLRADLRQGGETLAFASAILSAPRKVALPDLRPRIDVPPSIESAVAFRPEPVFTQHFDYLVTGRLPWTSGPEPEVTGYIRAKEAPRAVDAPLLIALLDSYWPAFFSVGSEPRPMTTVSFTAEIMCDPSALDPRAAFFYRARTIGEHEGFQVELRELYDERGELVALNQQTFAVLK